MYCKNHEFPRNRSAHILIFLGIVLFVYCSNEGEDRSGLTELKFTIDSTLLGRSILAHDIQLKFHPPSNWNLISDSMMLQLQNNLENILTAGDAFQLEILYVFFEEKSGGLCSICKLNSTTKTKRINEKMQIYKGFLESSRGSSTLKMGEFLKNGTHIFQFLIQNEMIVNFKLVFQNNAKELLQIDYVTPRKYYPENIKAIESSIGSISIV